jgi:hypothetical protein
MIKDNRKRLFEMMNKVSGMPLIESVPSEGGKQYPPGFSANDSMSLEDYANHCNLQEDENPNLAGISVDNSGSLDNTINARLSGKYKGNTPYIHKSTINKIRVVDENGNDMTEENFRKLTTIRPTKLIGSNTKMGKTNILKTSLPAYQGLYYDEHFPVGQRIRVINVCQNAGNCKIHCFQQKGRPVVFENASLDRTRVLNFLINDYEGFKSKMINEILDAEALGNSKNMKTIVRWHDSGDFISEKYLGIVIDIGKATPNVLHYAYTKMVGYVKKYAAEHGEDMPQNFIFRYSVDSGSPENSLINKKKDLHAEVVPRELYKPYVYTEKEPVIDPKTGKQKIARNTKGEMKPVFDTIYHYHSGDALNAFKQKMGEVYDIDPSSILSFSEMPEDEGQPNQYNVIVTPSDADTAAHRRDVLGVYLLEH